MKKQLERANSNIITLEYEYVEKQEDIRTHIQNCEGMHTQQAIYSTFHDALTQVCFGCMKVRSTIKRN
jgi:5-bromo-4-chloroindolyl phosphate hydrolysis protein